jgi:mRNA interferase MazF
VERFIRGDIVVLPFPFSDFSAAKRRRALVLATPGGDDLILLQITSQQIRDSYAVSISSEDFACGSLRKDSNVRPNRIFSACNNLILYRAGRLSENKLKEILNAVLKILEKD